MDPLLVLKQFVHGFLLALILGIGAVKWIVIFMVGLDGCLDCYWVAVIVEALFFLKETKLLLLAVLYRCVCAF